MKIKHDNPFIVCRVPVLVIGIAALLVKFVGVYFRKYIASSVQDGLTHSMLAHSMMVALVIDLVFYVLLLTVIVTLILSLVLKKRHEGLSSVPITADSTFLH